MLTAINRRGTNVSYAQRDETGDFEMVTLADECFILVIRERLRSNDPNSRLVTSVWTISADRRIRAQQRLPEDVEVVPYTVWGSENKVVIRIASKIRVHDLMSAFVKQDRKPVHTYTTSWTSYAFPDEHGANAFQAALMGRNLLLSAKTNKTLRRHEGIAGTFAFKEQMCGLENIRLWQERGQSNGVIAMIHFNPNFREGYLAFYVNSQRDRIRIAESSSDPRLITIKGLAVPIPTRSGQYTASLPSPSTSNAMGDRTQSWTGPGSGYSAIATPDGANSQQKSKLIRSVKVEFSSEEDKTKFLERVKEAQGYFFSG
jgi:hypothetical protein